MDVKNYLISTHGLSEDEAKVIADNPKYAAIYEKAAKAAEDGQTAYQKALEVKSTMETWNKNEVIPYVQKADASVAAAQARVAAQASYLATLKAQGYDIPAEYLAGAAEPVVPAKVTPVAEAKNYDDLIQKGQLAQMELIDLANEAFDLTGKRVSVNAEYKEFGSNARPGENLRSYITRKYDLDTIRTTKETERKAAYEKTIADNAVTAAKAEWAKSHGTNGETRIPQNSKFAEIAAQRKEGGSDKSWQTKQGRDEATQRRLEKYAGQIN